jgi:hypothetical protein
MKKHLQLGMNAGTASYRLTKDLLFDFVIRAGHVCRHCGGQIAREDFSIEHKTPWLDSDDPHGMFFDLENIAYSHYRCNVSAARRSKKWATEEERKTRDAAIERSRWQRMSADQQQAIRRGKYERNGC